MKKLAEIREELQNALSVAFTCRGKDGYIDCCYQVLVILILRSEMGIIKAWLYATMVKYLHTHPNKKSRIDCTICIFKGMFLMD